MATKTINSNVGPCAVAFTFNDTTKKLVSISYQYPAFTSKKKLRINVGSLGISVDVGQGTGMTTITIPSAERPIYEIHSKNGFDEIYVGPWSMSYGV